MIGRETSAKLDEVVSYPVLSRVGEPALEASVQAGTWKEAIKWNKSRAWRRCMLMPTNTLSRLAHQADWERGHEWNTIADELRPRILEWFDSYVLPMLREQKLPKVVGDTLRWYAIHICFEVEYQDLVPPLFFLPLIDPWLARGHFPCGWEGEEFPDGWDGKLPKGKLVVF